LLKGAHWTLLGYEVERDVIQPRPVLHIHTFGLPSGTESCVAVARASHEA
jgi:hypothetical protein